MFNTESFVSSEDNYVVDHFEPTPPMSTFTFGFVISQLALLARTNFADPRMKKLCINVYARPELHKDLDQTVDLIFHFRIKQLTTK